MHIYISKNRGAFGWFSARGFLTGLLSGLVLSCAVATAGEIPRSALNQASVDAKTQKVSHVTSVKTTRPVSELTAKSKAISSSKTAKAKTTGGQKSKVQVGSASWYGRAFQGRPTASGESYDMFRYTAAHRNLPLGTWVRVTNLRNGKSLIVKVNDRGPFVDTDHRIMDVSYAAARMLEFSGQGLARVKLEVVEPETMAYAAQGSLE